LKKVSDSANERLAPHPRGGAVAENLVPTCCAVGALVSSEAQALLVRIVI